MRRIYHGSQRVIRTAPSGSRVLRDCPPGSAHHQYAVLGRAATDSVADSWESVEVGDLAEGALVVLGSHAGHVALIRAAEDCERLPHPGERPDRSVV